jgi:hypothetical protein
MERTRWTPEQSDPRRRTCLLLGAALAVLVGVPRTAPAALPPLGFDLDVCTGEARLVVLGQLDPDGRLKVARVLRGKTPKDGTLSLGSDGGYWSLELARSMRQDSPVEVVAFLEQRGEDPLPDKDGAPWQPVRGRAGLVGLGPERVYLYGPVVKLGNLQGETEACYHDIPDRGYSRASFLMAVAEAVADADERDRLLALPRSADRARKLLDFLLGHSESSASYHLGLIARGLKPAHRAEEGAVLEAIKQAAVPAERELLLRLAGAVPLSGGAFEEVADWAERVHPPEVRRAAIESLARVVPYRAAGRLARLLSVDDPEVESVLRAVGDGADPDLSPRLNPEAVDALLVMACDLRQRVKAEGRDARRKLGDLLLDQVHHYAHPRLVPVLYEWARADAHGTGLRAYCYLRSLTGLEYAPEDRASWEAWWQGASRVLGARYDLQTEAGRRAWLEAYQYTDPAARRLLMRLWLFEPEIDEAWLLKAARGKKEADAAKAVLADLWRGRRLSPETKEAVVRAFVAVRLVEEPSPNRKQFPGSRELRLVADRDFPFPEEAWVQPGYDITIGDRPPRLGDSWGAISLEGTGSITLGAMGGGKYLGSPSARAVLAVREVNPHDGNKVAWQVQWSLGPVQLRDSNDP